MQIKLLLWTNRWIQLVIPFIQNLSKGTVDSGMKRPIERSLNAAENGKGIKKKVGTFTVVKVLFRCKEKQDQVSTRCKRLTGPFIPLSWSCFLVLKLEKGFTLDVITRGQSTTILLCIGPFLAKWRTTKQTNNRVILVQASSWPVCEGSLLLKDLHNILTKI